MDNYYGSALKSGKKQYQKCIANGEYPYLSVLDDILPEEKTAMFHDVGLLQIPTKFLVGTKTVGRTAMFARNFMPIADEKTEFASKWKRLCKSHLEEGIRDPIVVYEYMNRFYVEEGNKRASVLKFFDAVTIPAMVRRILPERDGSDAVERYYEFLNFSKLTQLNFIEFSEKGAYQQFLKLLGKGQRELWTEEESRHLRTLYTYFRKAYLDCGGAKFRATVADALLTYIQVYGYKDLEEATISQLKVSIRKAWREFALLGEEQKIEIQTSPGEQEENASLFSSLIGAKKKKIAFLYEDALGESTWTDNHEMGRLHVQNVLSDRIESIYYENVNEQNASQVMEQAIEEGASVIFATSADMMQGCLRIAVDYPQVSVLNCSLNQPHKALRLYYPRAYEAKFITGVIAGLVCEEEKVGYITKYPIYGTIPEINAFARGVQLVKPDMKVYLEWSSLEGGAKAAADRLLKKGVRLFSMRDKIKEENSERNFLGLTFLKDGEFEPVALPICNWGIYYEKIIRSILNKSFQNENEKTKMSLNYYWGMSAGVVEMVYSSKMPKGVRYLAETLSRAICEGFCQPFYNPGSYANGKIDWNTKDQSMTMEEIMAMDWLEENVVGNIPKYSQLEHEVQAAVDFVGVEAATRQEEERQAKEQRPS